jgi:hypothetical protein
MWMRAWKAPEFATQPANQLARTFLGAPLAGVTASVTRLRAFPTQCNAIAFTFARNGTPRSGAGARACRLLNQFFTDFGKDARVGQ